MSNKQAWEWIWPRIEETLGVWEAKEVEFATRVVIVNQVLLAKINFYLNIFPPSEGMIGLLEKCIQHYLWHNGGMSKMVWVKWDICTMKREDGGLGLRSIHDQANMYVLKH
eukprot:c47501_g1_i1 orf=3-332(-)